MYTADESRKTTTSISEMNAQFFQEYDITRKYLSLIVNNHILNKIAILFLLHFISVWYLE